MSGAAAAARHLQCVVDAILEALHARGRQRQRHGKRAELRCRLEELEQLTPELLRKLEGRAERVRAKPGPASRRTQCAA